jgi:hypothetical protein
MYEIILPLHTDKNILATTTFKGSLAVGRDMGFVLVERKMLPEEVWRGTCVCPVSKTGCTDGNARCKLAYGESQNTGDETCWLRVTGDTYKRVSLA